MGTRITLKIFILLAIWSILFYSFAGFAQEEEKPDLIGEDNAVYEAVSKDYQETDVRDVVVTRTTPFVMSYTVRECDMWIERFRLRAAENERQVKIWQGIREKVRQQAEKVKLKVLGERKM